MFPFAPLGSDYLGTFSLDPVTETPGSGSLAWHFTVDNSAIQFLAQGQVLTQDYLVSVTDNHGASTTQDVTSLASWSSSNTSAATVSGAGVVTGVGAGTAVITATYSSVVGSDSITVPVAGFHSDVARSLQAASAARLKPSRCVATNCCNAFALRRNELLVGGNSSLQGTVLVVIGNVVEKMLAVWAQT